jgi:prepilin-type processing-associated H-X9-DG protein
MSQQISCPHCGQTFQLTPEQVPQYSGQTITCTQCQRPFTVPHLAGAGAAPPPPPAPAPSTGGYPPGYPPSRHVGYATPQYAPQQTNGWAIASLVSGIIGFVIPLIPGLIAIVTGIIGIRKTADPRVGGKGLAIAGLSVGACSILLSGCMISILLPSLNRARETANRVKCASNMRQVGQAILLYSNENRGAYPPDIDAILRTQDITAGEFVCPSDSNAPATPAAGGPYSFVYAGPNLTTRTATADTIVLYEPLTNHNNDGGNILFGDGHVEFFVARDYQKYIAEVEAGQNPPPSILRR